MGKLVALVALCALSTCSFAVDFAHVPDASLIKWQVTPEGVVFLRNLNDYDASFLGCCYAWSIDTKTPTGKAMWATILMKMAAAKPISIGVDNKAVQGSVLYIGNH